MVRTMTDIKEKVIDYIQSDGIMHSLDMMTAPKAEFIEFFEKKVLEPRGLDYKIMFCSIQEQMPLSHS